MKRTASALVSALTVLLWWGSATAQSVPACLGVLAPLSGKHARIGKALLQTAEFAAAPLHVRIIAEDTRGQAATARSATARLAANPCVLAAIGPVGWKESRAAAEVAADRSLPLFVLSVEGGIETVGPTIFRLRPSIEEQSRAMARLARRDLALKRFAILHPDDEIGQRAADAFFEAVRREGGRVTALASYPAEETNLAKAVEELVGKRLPKLKHTSLGKPPVGWRRAVDIAPWVNFDALFIPDDDAGVTVSARFLTFHDVGLAGAAERASVQLLGVEMMAGPRHRDAGGLTAGALYPALWNVTSELDESAARTAIEFKEATSRDIAPVDAHVIDITRILAGLVRLPAADPEGRFAPRRTQLVADLVELEPKPYLTGLRWFQKDGTPGCRFRLYVVDAGGTASTTDP